MLADYKYISRMHFNFSFIILSPFMWFIISMRKLTNLLFSSTHCGHCLRNSCATVAVLFADFLEGTALHLLVPYVIHVTLLCISSNSPWPLGILLDPFLLTSPSVVLSFSALSFLLPPVSLVRLYTVHPVSRSF